jgi:hypothetical protein
MPVLPRLADPPLRRDRAHSRPADDKVFFSALLKELDIKLE